MSDPTVTVVVIDADKAIRRFIRTSLEAAGMSVFDAQTGAQGLAQAATRLADLVIIDLSLPDMDGIEVIRELRGWSAMPVIVLSARSREEDKVAALDAGADDYLTKPFGLPELSARIRAHLRRQASGDRVGVPQVQFGLVTIDLGERRVVRGSRIVHLSPTEYRLLSALVRHPGRVLTHEQLLGEVWGPLQTDNHHYLRIYMGHLRHKLERDPAHPEHIVTEAGVGYRLVGVR
ncbi:MULTISPECIES: response regulator [Paraburkholderia]|jgi:two-component system KDP operon response regulator KdpE|uniref:Two-component system, OmpR family, KDP operon response regulator KdpE n=1 Tax=Paraburkholderia aspalathi TaxID=1324617 RepID=A0A1I6ZF15_9BURK|nr:MULTISPECIES: response regulator [Paraburkholderia]MCP2090578.1 two-component system KDP operon response regulator KdpE [Paraburkholderia sediminicola]MCX4138705.1 response regulator [Paraburkholderia aspalathi]MCX4154188.1 response regulator [Paraburkholderia aspalathi]MDN7163604.1 response regulator [Paraburkholderia sp. SECH2]MDN7171395.1 response regulator [Paraburkholderia sp. SEWSISQ10-3 4]